jgi:hypothetical protein
MGGLQMPNYIDPGLKALERLRDVLVAHQMQMLNVKDVGFASIASMRSYGYKGDVSPSVLTVEIAILGLPDVNQDDGSSDSKVPKKSE